MREWQGQGAQVRACASIGNPRARTFFPAACRLPISRQSRPGAISRHVKDLIGTVKVKNAGMRTAPGESLDRCFSAENAPVRPPPWTQRPAVEQLLPIEAPDTEGPCRSTGTTSYEGRRARTSLDGLLNAAISSSQVYRAARSRNRRLRRWRRGWFAMKAGLGTNAGKS